MSNLFSKLGSFVTSAYDKAKSLLSYNGPVGPGKGMASANQGLNFDTPANNALQAGRSANQTMAPNMTVAPTATDPGGPGRDGVSVNNPFYKAGEGQAVSSLAKDAGARPSTYVAPPTDNYNRTSSKESGVPYFNSAGRLIVPKTGFSGMAGSGGSGMQTSTPMTSGMSGMAGGGSAYTGLLGGVGTTSAGGSNTSDEELRKDEKNKRDTVNLNTDQGYTQKALESITSPFEESQFTAPSVPDTIDAGYLQKIQDSVNKISTAGASLSAADRQTYISQIATNLMAAKTKLDQQQAIPDNPVVDTEEQMAWLEMSEDAFGDKNLMDQWRAENTNLSNLQHTRVDLMKNVQALNEAYRPILKDIKENPDLPKALARRRIEDLATTQKEVMQGFLDQLQIVNQEVDDQNEMVNRAFNIMTFAVNQQDKARDNARQNLSLMISSGAIAGFTNTEIKNYAEALGVSTQTLQKAKEAAMTPKVTGSPKTDKNGDLVMIDEKTGKEVWRIKGFDKAPGSGAAQTTQWQTENDEISAARAFLSKKTPAGAPVTDANGYFTVDGFKYLLANTTLPRDRFIKEMAGNISPWNSENYGLTPAERKSLGYK